MAPFDPRHGIVEAVTTRDRKLSTLTSAAGAILGMALLGACATTPTPSPEPPSRTRSAAPGDPQPIYGKFIFPGRDRLVTNEYAHWNPDSPDARTSPDWDMTSGSLFLRGGVAYSGRPDRGHVDATSSQATNSAIFRLVTKSKAYENVSLSFRFRLLTYTGQGPSDDWNGLHLWLRYQDPTSLYTVSVARRDGTVAFKRKDPGGPDNGGRYTLLASRSAGVSGGQWHTATATIRDVEGGVHFTLDIDGSRVLEATDDDDPLRAPGGIGIRADNLEFEFADVTVSPV